jgi:glycine/D-amino acid oxidase-like deaminating enzyme
VVRAAVWYDDLGVAEHAALAPGIPERFDRRPDVLVVGGGAVGLATAVAGTLAGLGRVLVLEKEERLAGAASGGNGGAIAPDMHAYTDPPEFVAFGRASLARYRELDALWDNTIGLRTTRWLDVGGPGGPVLTADQVREIEPDLVLPEGGTARLVENQAAVNPQRLASVLARHAGTVATGVAVTGVRTAGDRITVVHTSAGDVYPGAVVMATGLVPPPWSSGIAQRWVKGHMVAVAPGPWWLGSVVAGERGGGTPLPDGTVICGGTFDPDLSPDLDPVAVDGLLAGLARVLPAARDARVTHRWCCFRPVVDGRRPVIDRLPGTTNGFVSAGHFTTGIMYAAGTGQALASWIADGEPPLGVATFSLGSSDR